MSAAATSFRLFASSREAKYAWISVALVACVACGGDDDEPDSGASDSGSDAGSDSSSDSGDAESDAGPPDLGLTPSDELAFEDDPAGAWYAGDVHVHATGASNDTGGDSFPEDIKTRALEEGLYFVVLTDHSNSTGSDVTTTEEDPDLFNMGPEFPYWDTAAALTEPGRFLMIDGNEISPVMEGEIPTDPTGHIGCLPIDLDTFDRDSPFIDRPRGTISGGNVLMQARERGCYTVLNHPYADAVWTSFDWTDSGVMNWGYEAMEVWNGTLSFRDDDAMAFDAWRCDLLAGRNVTPIGASDCHRINTPAPGRLFDPAIGYPRTYVWATGDTWPDIVEGMRSGMVSIGEGESFLTIDGYASDGSRAEDSTMAWLRVRLRVDEAAGPATFRMTRAFGCDDPRPTARPAPTIEEEVLLEVSVDRAFEADGAIAVTGEPGVYTATFITRRRPYSAFSRAIVVTE